MQVIAVTSVEHPDEILAVAAVRNDDPRATFLRVTRANEEEGLSDERLFGLYAYEEFTLIE